MSSAPSDLFYAWGKDGQYVVMVPSRDLVIVRLGMTPLDDRWRLEAFLQGVAAAFPENLERVRR
jgi:CubicO group peptidase (beta-lactamase class C family)